ncbi:MAG TPA: DNA polymerase IV [Ktedonobacterales bacterium]|nr:DNA polymerase IV [Ktedonobacterales bacterium]
MQSVRRVMHADLDCFYAAVEELDDPSLRGRPVIVGGDPDRRGVVSTANYAARRYGVHSAMAAALARRLCPEAIFLPPRFDRYKAVSQQVMDILDDYFVVREQVSIDEAYGELTPGVPGCQPAERIAREIKARVRDEAGLVISIGAGRSKSIAKLASDLSKPDGCLIVRPGAELAFLHPLPVGRLAGVGPQTRARLEKAGLATVGQIATQPREALAAMFGKHGDWLWQLANAQDDRPVVADYGPPKSISTEDTFERDIADLERASEHVRRLAEHVTSRLSAKGLIGRTVTLKVKWANFRLMTRQQSLSHPTADAQPIAETAIALLNQEVAPALASGEAIRLLGVAVSGITPLDPSLWPTSVTPHDIRGYVQLPLPLAGLKLS